MGLQFCHLIVVIGKDSGECVVRSIGLDCKFECLDPMGKDRELW